MIGAQTGLYKLDVFWEIEVEWFGLIHAEGVPQEEKKEEEKGVIFSDSKEALMALETGQQVQMVDRAAFDALRKPPVKEPVLLSSIPDVEKEKIREDQQQAALVEDYVQVKKK